MPKISVFSVYSRSSISSPIVVVTAGSPISMTLRTVLLENRKRLQRFEKLELTAYPPSPRTVSQSMLGQGPSHHFDYAVDKCRQL